MQSKHYLEDVLNCNACHSSHSNGSEGKMLRASTYQICAVCHGSTYSVNEQMPFTAQTVEGGVYDRRSHLFIP